MSQTDTPTSDTASQYQGIVLETDFIYALTALITYEYVVTFGQEVEAMWLRKWTGATWLFLVNRYMMIAGVVIAAAPYTADTYVCRALTPPSYVVQLALYALYAAFASLRLYALYDRTIVWSSIVLALGLVPVVADIYIFANSNIAFVADPLFGGYCYTSSNLSGALQFRLTLASRLSVTIADVLVISLTWMKTFRHKKEASRLNMKLPLSTLIIRDGTLYFIAILVMNVAQVLVVNTPLEAVGLYLNFLSPILISRFLLNLRQVDQAERGSEETAFNSRFSVPGFRVPTVATITGNMGESLHFIRPVEVQSGPQEDIDPHKLNGSTAQDINSGEIREVPRENIVELRFC